MAGRVSESRAVYRAEHVGHASSFMWFAEEAWRVSDSEANVGTSVCTMRAASDAWCAEEIGGSTWQLLDDVDDWMDAEAVYTEAVVRTMPQESQQGGFQPIAGMATMYTLPARQRLEALSLHQQVDVDRNGWIDRTEFAGVVPSALQSRIDALHDKVGHVSADAFVQFLEVLGGASGQTQVNKVLSHLRRGLKARDEAPKVRQKESESVQQPQTGTSVNTADLTTADMPLTDEVDEEVSPQHAATLRISSAKRRDECASELRKVNEDFHSQIDQFGRPLAARQKQVLPAVGGGSFQFELTLCEYCHCGAWHLRYSACA